MMNYRRTLLLTVVACLVAQLPGVIHESMAHPCHVSFAEVEWNAKTGNLEVALKLDPDDLEQAVRRHCGKRISIDHADSAAVIEAYIRKNFTIATPRPKVEGKDATSLVSGRSNVAKNRFQWIGSEINEKTAWLYFEIAAKDGPEGMVVRNGLLANAPHPTNTVHIRSGKRSATMTFSRQSTKRVVRLVEPQASNQKGPDAQSNL